MKISKRIVTVMLAAAMAASIAGCTNKPANESSSTGESASASTESSEVSESEVPEEPEETANLIWYIVGGGKTTDHDMVMEDLNAKLVEKINATLDLRCLNWGEFNDQMKLITTSQEDYDLTFTSNWSNSFTDNISRDAFLDITDLYAEYGKDIAAQVPEWLTDVAKVNGRLYAIPNQQILAGGAGLGIQKSLVDKYNIDVNDLTTYDSLENVLEMIHENEPDLIPISILDHNLLCESKYEGLANGTVYVEMGDESFTCVGMDVAQEADMRMHNDWYKRGFIREDVATNSDTSPYFAANKFAIQLNVYKPGLAAEYEASQGIEFIASRIGIEADQPFYITYDAGVATMTAININSKNPVAAMKLINLVHADKDVYNEIVSGIEGVHYEMIDELHMKPILDAEGSPKYGYPDWEIGNVFNGHLLEGKADDTWEETDKMNKEATVSLLRGFTFDPTNVQSELAQISAVAAEFKNMEYITDDIDQLIADRSAKLKSAGLDRVVEEVQTQINAWAEVNGK